MEELVSEGVSGSGGAHETPSEATDHRIAGGKQKRRTTMEEGNAINRHFSSRTTSEGGRSLLCRHVLLQVLRPLHYITMLAKQFRTQCFGKKVRMVIIRTNLTNEDGPIFAL